MTSKINKSHLTLLKIIETNGNKYCADCGVEGTRWASWNFGIFLCIRCAGIHRNLGVHISKVKSVDLDSWTNEQLRVMELIGNNKSQEIYEAALPKNFIRPQSNYAIEEFIRSKYQHKRYCIEQPKTDIINENTTETKSSRKEITPKELISIDGDINLANTISETDDSLSDPEYLIQIKEKKKKACHKVHSESDLINFNCGPGSTNIVDSIKSDNKSKILSFYDQNNVNGGYQHTANRFMPSSHHKSYGSSVDSQFNPTTSIPASSQTSYLKQIQEKLTVMKDNLTSKFKQYEQPKGSPYQPTNISFESHVSPSNNIGPNGGHTLSPDLWR